MNRQEIETIAMLAHEANILVQAANAEEQNPPWEDAPDWLKRSIIDGVTAITRGTVVSPEESHRNWLAHKQADGWVWGEKKDPEAQTHPCMVPYDALPARHRLKDHVFFTIVQTMAKAIEGGR